MRILRHYFIRIKMKYIDFESWTITWLHEGNVIVEDQLTPDLCSTQLFLDSNQIGNFESWVESAHDSTIFFRSLIRINSWLNSFCGKLIRISLWLNFF